MEDTAIDTDEKGTFYEIDVEEYKDTLVCRPHDPYGFWLFSWKSGGEIPDALKGAYTSWDEARKGVNHFINEKGKAHAERVAREAAREREIEEKSAKARAEWEASQADKPSPAPKRAPAKKVKEVN
jgi:hypothetical protein